MFHRSLEANSGGNGRSAETAGHQEEGETVGENLAGRRCFYREKRRIRELPKTPERLKHAMLSSTNYRRTMQYAVEYHQLATPLAEIDFKEAGGCGIWTFTPMAHPHIDASLYRFLVEMQFGIIVSLHRDFMGPSFAGRQLHVTYGAPDKAPKYSEMFGCPVLFSQTSKSASV